jgi:hypothetical protein
MHVAVASAVATAVRGGDRDRVVEWSAVSASDAYDHCTSIVPGHIDPSRSWSRASVMLATRSCME